MAYKSIYNIKNQLLSEFNIKNTDKLIMAIGQINRKVFFKNGEKYQLKKFLEKIEQKLENSDKEIFNLFPVHGFGMITKGIFNTKNNNEKNLSQKDMKIPDNYPEDDDDCAKKFGDDAIIQEERSRIICALANYKMTKSDLEYCLKIFDLENAKFNNYDDAFCCLALKMDSEEKQNLYEFLNNMSVVCLYSSAFYDTKNLFNIHVKSMILNSETDRNKINTCLFHDNEHKSLKYFLRTIYVDATLKNP